MSDTTKKTIHVVCVILEDSDQQIFVAKRPEGKALAGGCEFPGGKIEAGETHAVALKREIHEELEIQIEVGAALPASSYDYDFGTVILHPYRASIQSGVINLTKASFFVIKCALEEGNELVCCNGFELEDLGSGD